MILFKGTKIDELVSLSYFPLSQELFESFTVHWTFGNGYRLSSTLVSLDDGG